MNEPNDNQLYRIVERQATVIKGNFAMEVEPPVKATKKKDFETSASATVKEVLNPHPLLNENPKYDGVSPDNNLENPMPTENEVVAADLDELLEKDLTPALRQKLDQKLNQKKRLEQVLAEKNRPTLTRSG